MDFENKRVVVIGATGFIGSHLVDHLVARGANVLAIARTENRRLNLEAAGGRYEFAACDIVVSPELGDVFKRFQPSILYHLAAHPDAVETAEHIEASLTVNTLGTLRVLDASRSAGVKRIVYGGSSKIFGHHQVPSNSTTPASPVSSYSIAKAAGWQLCKLFTLLRDMEAICLNPAFVYGPRQNWNLIRYVEQCIRTGETVRLQGGGQTRDPLYVGDVVEAYIAAGTRPNISGESIPVGGGTELPVADLARKILESLGAPDAPIEIGGEELRPTEIWRNFTDNVDAKRLLGWSPNVSLEEGLRMTVSSQVCYRAHATSAGRAA